jgi:lysophospholipase L1-like esterase
MQKYLATFLLVMLITLGFLSRADSAKNEEIIYTNIFFGDSNTMGAPSAADGSVAHQKTYPKVLNLGKDININAGIDGDNVQKIANRAVYSLEPVKTRKRCFVLAGVNDMGGNKTASDIYGGLLDLGDMLSNSGCEVYLLTYPNSTDHKYYEQLSALNSALRTNGSYRVIDLAAELAQTDVYMENNWHFSTFGHYLIAQVIQKALL